MVEEEEEDWDWNGRRGGDRRRSTVGGGCDNRG